MFYNRNNRIRKFCDVDESAGASKSHNDLWLIETYQNNMYFSMVQY